MAAVFSLLAVLLLQEGSTMSAPYCLIQLESFGFEDPAFEAWKSAMFINGKKMDTMQFDHAVVRSSFKHRGVKIAIFSLSNTVCEEIFTEAYDTHVSPNASSALSYRLLSLTNGTMVVGITDDDFTKQLMNANDTLKELGLMIYGGGNRGKWFRSSAAWVAIVGDPSRTRVVQQPRGQGPAVLTFDLLANTCKMTRSGYFNIITERVFFGAEPVIILTDKTKTECVGKCLQTSSCMTINVIEQPGGRLCQLFKERRGYRNTAIKASANTSILELIKCL